VANSTAGLKGDSYLAVINPASICQLRSKTLSFTYSTYLFDLSFFGFSLGLPFNINKFAFNLMHLNLGDFKKTVTEGGEITTENAGYQTAMILSYSRNIMGINGKLFLSNLAGEKITSFCFDIGFLKEDVFIKNLSVGGVIQNIWFRIKYRNLSESMPLNFKIATSYLLNLRKNQIKFMFDLNVPSYYEIYSGIGTEFEYKIGKDFGLQLRAGYKINQDLGVLSGFTCGAGIKYFVFSLDYAFVNYDVLENVNKITLSLKF